MPPATPFALATVTGALGLQFDPLRLAVRLAGAVARRAGFGSDPRDA